MDGNGILVQYDNVEMIEAKGREKDISKASSPLSSLIQMIEIEKEPQLLLLVLKGHPITLRIISICTATIFTQSDVE